MIDLRINKNISEKQILKYQKKVTKINKMIEEKTGAGSDFLGWEDWPVNYDKKELDRIIKDAKYVRENYDILVVIGIGGSYLGPQCAYRALKGYHNESGLELVFAGQTFSPNYMCDVLNYIRGKKFAINVISKSGTTTETAICFRLVKQLLEEQVGKKEAAKAIFATTDKEKGTLRKLSEKEGYTTYVLPSDIGGRYSVLTPVGTFPLAAAGFDVKAMLKGAAQAREKYSNDDLKINECYRYAVCRDFLYRRGYPVELFVTYDPDTTLFLEWLKQLFGESEGKESKGIFPSSGTFSTDLHSFGQFIQEGSPVLFETILQFDTPRSDIKIPKDEENADGLNYIQGKSLSYINKKVFEATLSAHEKGHNVPCNVVTMKKLDEKSFGYLFYFFMRACAMSAYLLEINPFNQPGVEIYKKNMFHLLGKEGY